jgi:hypothetical protein
VFSATGKELGRIFTNPIILGTILVGIIKKIIDGSSNSIKT